MSRRRKTNPSKVGVIAAVVAGVGSAFVVTRWMLRDFERRKGEAAAEVAVAAAKACVS